MLQQHKNSLNIVLVIMLEKFKEKSEENVWS